MEEKETKSENQKDEVPAVVPSHRSYGKIHHTASGCSPSIGEQPEAEEGNQTEDGKIVQVR